jgi:hypothetical protein
MIAAAAALRPGWGVILLAMDFNVAAHTAGDQQQLAVYYGVCVPRERLPLDNASAVAVLYKLVTQSLHLYLLAVSRHYHASLQHWTSAMRLAR